MPSRHLDVGFFNVGVLSHLSTLSETVRLRPARLEAMPKLSHTYKTVCSEDVQANRKPSKLEGKFGMSNLQKRVGIHTKDELKLEDLLDRLKVHERFKDVGGIGIFIGVTRSSSADGKPVSHLELEAYEDKAEEAMASIANDVASRSGIVDVLIHHVVGKLKQGELIMAVLVAGRSRKDVFPALIETVERTKSTVPIWKKEFLTSGESYWVSEKGRTVKPEKD